MSNLNYSTVIPHASSLDFLCHMVQQFCEKLCTDNTEGITCRKTFLTDAVLELKYKFEWYPGYATIRTDLGMPVQFQLSSCIAIEFELKYKVGARIFFFKLKFKEIHNHVYPLKANFVKTNFECCLALCYAPFK